MKKRYSTFTLICSVLIAVFISFEVTYIFADTQKRREIYALSEKYKNQYEELDTQYAERYASLNEMYNALPEDMKSSALFKKLAYLDVYYRAKYVGKLDEEKLAYYVMSGYVAGTGDKYGEYYSADELETIFEESDGNTVGIGVYVTYNSDTGYVEILSVMKDSPAEKAGMAADDVIVKVDGEDLASLGYYGALNKMKGKEGTAVKVTVLRSGKEIEFSLVRAKVKSQPVSYHKYKLDETIGFIRITEFNDAVPEQFKAAVSALLDDGVESLVFDVRNNPGGTLDSVVKMLDYLLPEGDIVFITDANGKVVKKYTSDASSIDVPMAVLVNGNTASAAELFTCALKDYGKAMVVGEKTYGKGCMQTIVMLPDGSGLRFTTNMYNPPKSENYDGKGIEPDVKVSFDKNAASKNFYRLTDEEDNQLLEACRKLGYEG